MKLYIGISGGHQKSTAVAVDGDSVIGCVTGEGLNVHATNNFKVANRLGALLETLAGRVKLKTTQLREQAVKLVLALPGAETGYGQHLAETCLVLNDWKDRAKFRVADDTWAGLVGGGLDRRGICAVAGTGAAVYVGLGEFPDSKSYKIDGWGHILGDYGSGFQLALNMFRLIGRALDRGGAPPLFDELLAEEPRIGDVDNVQHWFDQLYIAHTDDWRIRFARLASVVTQAAGRAENPDPDALRLTEKAAEDMAQTISIAIERFEPLSGELPIILQGGMFEHSDLYRRAVTRLVRQRHANAVRMAAFRPAVGAALMACAEDSILPDPETRRRLIESIGALPQTERDFLTYPASSALLD